MDLIELLLIIGSVLTALCVAIYANYIDKKQTLPARRISGARPRKKSCKCENINIGSYSRQTSMINPFTNKWVCVDTCLVQEIAELWHEGVETVECCCGHNKMPGYIAIKSTTETDWIMLRLGYEPYRHPNGLDGFYKPLTETKPETGN